MDLGLARMLARFRAEWSHPTRRPNPAPPSSEGLFTDEDRGWRVAGSLNRDLTAAERVDNMNNADDAWRHNPIANAIVGLQLDMALGQGLHLTSNVPALAAWLDRWWHHRQCRLPLEQFTWATELALTGNLFITLHTNPIDRLTYVRIMPTALVDQIETDPNDYARVVRIHQAYPADRWWTSEEMLHYGVNRLAGSVWGQGDLDPLLPWLRRYRDWLTNRIRNSEYRNAHVWDVTLRGADEAGIRRRRQELATPPSPGSVIVHNESEEWSAPAPSLDGAAADGDGKAVRRMIATGARVPLHYLAEADDANRATAREQSVPTIRHYQRRQLELVEIFVAVATECAARAGFDEADLATIAPIVPDLDTADNNTIGSAARNLAGALETAQLQGWLSPDECRQALLRILGDPARSPNAPGDSARAGPPRPHLRAV